MSPQFLDRAVVEGSDGRFLGRSDYAFGLAVGPGVIAFGEAVFDSFLPADAAEDVADPVAANDLVAVGELRLGNERSDVKRERCIEAEAARQAYGQRPAFGTARTGLLEPRL